MEKGFFLTSASVSSLAELTLCIAILIYILGLKDKSTDTWCIIIVGIVSSIYFFGSFVIQSTKSNSIQEAHGILICLVFLTQTWFAYKFGGNPFKYEMQTALIVSAAILFVTFYKDITGSLTYPIIIIGQAWNAFVFLRKAEWVSKNENSILKTDSQHFKSSFKGALQQFFQPSNRESKMFRDFSGWSFILFTLWIDVNLVFLFGIKWLSNQVFLYTFHPLLYVAIIYPAIIYLNYSHEKTAFQAKLIGVVLSIMLTLLGLIPFILFGTGAHSGENEQHAMLSLAALIPIFTLIIVSGLPLFFRDNLLKPLNKIVDGVKMIHAGELGTSISVEVKDEFGSLAQHFNEMTNSLRQYSMEMEELVALRTEELSQSLKELKQTQSHLIQSEKMASLGELTAGIAHEIQNPLNFVNNFSEVNREMIDELKEELKTGNIDEAIAIADDIGQNEEKIKHHGKRADAIVKGMLEHSRSRSGQKEPTDLNAMADECVRISYHGLSAKDKSFNAGIVTCFDEKLPKINVVQQDISRVLLNLFNNAFYAVNQKAKIAGGAYKPEVSVTTSVENGQVVMKVKDNGVGIPDAIVDKIMQPFFTTKPTGEGTGLGLSLTYDIVVKGHGGSIQVNSTEGEFTEFVVSLPL